MIRGIIFPTQGSVRVAAPGRVRARRRSRNCRGSFAPSRTQGAIRPLWLRPAMKVWVCQWPKRAWSIRRLPTGAQPVVLTRLVLRDVS